MSQLEYDVMKKVLIETEKTNELLAKQNKLLEILTTKQQPKAEVVSDKPKVTKPRGNRRGNQKQS